MGDPKRKPLRSIDDLLTDEQNAELRADLALMAKQRRMAEDAAAFIPLGSARMASEDIDG